MGSIVLLLGTGNVLQAENKKTDEKKEEVVNVGPLLDNMLPHLVNSKGEEVDGEYLKEKEYIVIYWAASWCGKCRKLTPHVVDFYNKTVGGGKYEVIMIGVDKSPEKMLNFMVKSGMKWNTVEFSQRRGTRVKSFAKGGIPRMMIFDKEGDIVARDNAFLVFPKLIELVTGQKVQFVKK